jgi:hypothetical protein
LHERAGRRVIGPQRKRPIVREKIIFDAVGVGEQQAVIVDAVNAAADSAAGRENLVVIIPLAIRRRLLTTAGADFAGNRDTVDRSGNRGNVIALARPGRIAGGRIHRYRDSVDLPVRVGELIRIGDAAGHERAPITVR